MAEADFGQRLARTRAAIAQAGLDGLLITSQYNRRYLTGFTAHDGDITESSGWVLVTPNTFGLVAGTFQLSGVEDEIVPSGVQVLSTDKATPWGVVAEAIKADGAKRLGFEKDWISYDRYSRLNRELGADAELIPADDMVQLVRAVKDAAEIATMRRAADVADQAFEQLLTEIKVGMTEREIATLLEQHMIELGASGTSFSTIVACGPGGAQPHAVPTDRPVRPGEPLLIDFGCRVDGYCSDTTRTFCIGEPDPKLTELYAIVREAQDAGFKALADGVRKGRDVDLAARKIIEDAGYGEQYFHSLGHGIGLAIHELPVTATLRVQTPEADAELAKREQLEPNSVISNEPGIYIPGWGGVRLEDMVLVTADGYEIMTTRNPEHVRSIAG
ncbi:MAG TPA: Xaa-Pro peptidase family protein [Ktedonobacterales bacterium]|nr:Xaa-Pro peptidase family protein [Ktedonobacterales bacterium]